MFFSRKEYQSAKNGTIIVSKFPFSAPSVSVQSCQQSGPYIIDMWKSSLLKLPNTDIPKNILLLGLGGGNLIALLQKKIPNSSIQVIEWDEIMIAIAKELKLFTQDGSIKIANEDAFKMITSCNESYDLIIVDLFTGEVPPIELTEKRTLESLKKILSANGRLLVNYYKHELYKNSFANHFSEELSWKFQVNNLSLFSHKQN